MNQINKKPLHSIGYHFVAPEFIPQGKNEYYLRDKQNRNGTASYRHLTAFEIEVLVRNNNTSDDWNKILVSHSFNPELVKNCKFFGLIRIGKLEPWFLEFHNLRMPVGLYNSTIISSDFGDNVVIDNVNYLSHYIIGNEVMVVNTNELATTSTAKFGNGIIKEGENEQVRIWLEVCNENGGRKILPFNGMLPGDAWIWSKFRDDEELMATLQGFTEKAFDTKRGYYGKIGDRTVIKNCKIIKDVWIGSDAYLKGANKIKNVTINSSPDAMSQVGEGSEMVNGIMGFGCRAFYGIKAVRFVMASHSQLKYGARLINSYLGHNATISCCEVLNSLIYPFHEQHHNNSFLCAALVMGQSNMAAGATIGSNHNSRSPDGELVAGRGFWPGLCVSLKHNSRFASFCIMAKGDYPSELNIPLPFSLVSHDTSRDCLQVMPGYWFMYNLYALTRNEWKYGARDERRDKIQLLETAYLAPDTIHEMVNALSLLELYTGMAWYAHNMGGREPDHESCRSKGKELLMANDPCIDTLEIRATGFENSQRPVYIQKTRRAYAIFRELIRYYFAGMLVENLSGGQLPGLTALQSLFRRVPVREEWLNVGGQLIAASDFRHLREQIKKGKINSWDDLHRFYRSYANDYPRKKLLHAWACLKHTEPNLELTSQQVMQLIGASVETRNWLMEGIYQSREKDYTNPFRQMVYENPVEMEKVTGSLSDNSFIQMKRAELSAYKKKVDSLLKRLKKEAPVGKRKAARV